MCYMHAIPSIFKTKTWSNLSLPSSTFLFYNFFTLVVLVILESTLCTNRKAIEKFDVKVDVQKGVLTSEA